MHWSVKALAVAGAAAIGAGVAVPNMVQARKHGNEASSIGALKTLATSQAIFREGDKEQDGDLDYGMLRELNNTKLIDSVLGSGTKCGYLFQAAYCPQTSEFLWFGLANPAIEGTTGDRHFDTNQAGVVFHSTPPIENAFKVAKGDDATSTFAVDVDTASYSLVKRYLDHQTLPPPELVRVEELVNRFDIRDPAPPTDGKPFAARVEVASCPWKPAHRLVRIALRGREIEAAKRPATNLVFLVDVSGSMQSPERLPLVKQTLRLLVDQLGERDRVSLVVYAGAAGLVLPPTPGTQRGRILAAIDRLEAGGSTNGGAGIELAYRTAIESFVQGGSNRVVLCTDGDFNVGLSSADSLESFIEKKRATGVFLSALGFGIGATGDATMERLADRGNGFFAAITDEKEARRVIVKELQGTLFTIAKDVKVQVAFDSARVKSWRLVGYENRVMANADFKNDAKDGGEIGAGHRVTALYEVEPAPESPSAPSPISPSAPYPDSPSERSESRRGLLTLRLRWKAPDGETSTGLEVAAPDSTTDFANASSDFKFAASVATGALLLRHSAHAGDATFAKAIRWAEDALGADEKDDRREWIDLLRKAEALAKSPG